MMITSAVRNPVCCKGKYVLFQGNQLCPKMVCMRSNFFPFREDLFQQRPSVRETQIHKKLLSCENEIIKGRKKKTFF